VSKGRHLHYLFTESLDKPESDPVLIFFNGGPGGASISLAFVKMGPLTYINETYLKPSNYSWNRRANVLYIDNPAGVGYSYAEKPRDIKTNDY
jgi:cathepsin A (carboxypeptidase C)